MRRKIRPMDLFLRGLIWLSAALTMLVLITILYHVLSNGLSHISWTFITDIYDPSNGHFGILPMIINTLYIVFLTLLIAVPIGVGGAIYLTEYAAQGLFVRAVRYTTEILAGIPSIIFGLFGFLFFVLLLGLKYSILAGSLTLTMMVLPTIIRTTEEAIKTVPNNYREGAIALGASKLRIIVTIVLPSAMPGIATGLVLSIGRMVGESAALIFTAGIVYRMPEDFLQHVFSSGRTLTLQLYQLAVLGEPLEQTYATATILLILVLVLNLLAGYLAKAFDKNH